MPVSATYLLICMVMAYVVMACMVMEYVSMAYIVMEYTVMAYIVMAFIVMAYMVMVRGRRRCPCLTHTLSNNNHNDGSIDPGFFFDTSEHADGERRGPVSV